MVTQIRSILCLLILSVITCFTLTAQAQKPGSIRPVAKPERDLPPPKMSVRPVENSRRSIPGRATGQTKPSIPIFKSLSRAEIEEEHIDLPDEPPFILYLEKVVKKDVEGVWEVDRVLETLYGGAVICEGEAFRLKLKPNPEYSFDQVIGYHIRIITIDNENKILQLFPNEFSELSGDELVVSNKESEIILPGLVEVVPPFGQERFMALMTPYRLNYEVTKDFADRDLLASTTQSFSNDDLLWMIQGEAPVVFEHTTYSTLITESKKWAAHYGMCADDDFFIRCPIIEFIQPLSSDGSRGAKPLVSKSTKYVLKGNVISRDTIQWVEVNDVQAVVQKTTTPFSYSWVKEVSLRPGENIFEVAAATVTGNSWRRSLFMKHDPSEPDEVDTNPSINYLVTIGIDDYEQWPKLDQPVKDCKGLSAVLQETYQFHADHTIALYNDEATKTGIDNLLRDLYRKVDDNDNVLIYYAGHGYLDKDFEDEGYWIPVDASTDNTSDYLTNDLIFRRLRSLKSKHTLLIADACFAGSLYKSRGSGPDAFTESMSQLRSKWVYSSGGLEEVADQLFGEDNSPFAHYLIKYLSENDKQALSIMELASEVTPVVSNVTDGKQTPLAAPVKEAGDEGGQFIFYRQNP